MTKSKKSLWNLYCAHNTSNLECFVQFGFIYLFVSYRVQQPGSYCDGYFTGEGTSAYYILVGQDFAL